MIFVTESTGSGGRAMYYFWSVSSTTSGYDYSNMTELANTFNNMSDGHGVASPVFGHTHFGTSKKFNFVLIVTKFFGYSAQSSKFNVIVYPKPIPLIYIDGLISRTLMVSSSISILANVSSTFNILYFFFFYFVLNQTNIYICGY